MLVHCGRKFRPDEIQFLRDNEHFTHRRLEIGICPGCEHKLARIVETRIQDGMVFDNTFQRRKANRLIKECEKDIDYTSLDLPKQRKCLFGFKYGETTERVYKDGTRVVTQKACDFYGNKETVKQEKTS